MNSIAVLSSHRDDPPGQRALAAWIRLATLLCFAALAAPFFLGRVYVADDLGEFHLPTRNFYGQQLQHGEPFDWMPGLYGGFYIAGEGQLGAYHPLHLALYRWLPLGAAFDLELLVSYPLLFVGTYLFLRRAVGRRDAALFGALAFAFSGFNLLHFMHPNAIAIVAHIPWLLWAIDVSLSSDLPRQRAAADLGIALLTASQLLLGYPQYVWLSLLAEVACVVWVLLAKGVPWQRTVPLVLAKTFGALAGAIQLLPTMDALADSVRRTPDAAFAASGSLHPLNLVQLVAPYLFVTRVVGQNTHELGLYAGAVPLALCVWLAANRCEWGRYRPLIRALAIGGGLALVLAAGEFGGLYRLQALVPLVNRFRFPCRAIVLVQFSMCAGAAVALAILLEHGRAADRQRTGRRALGLLWAASFALAILGPLLWPEFVASGVLIWSGPLLLGVAAGLVLLVERGARWATVALVLFAAIDLCCYGLSYAVWPHTADLHEFVADIPRPDDLTNPRVAVRAESGQPRVGDRVLLAGLKRADGYAGLEPARRLDYRQTSTLRLAGVGWVLQSGSDAQKGGHLWRKIDPTAPRARLVTQTANADRLADIDALGLETAVVEHSIELPDGSPGIARASVDLPGRLAIDVDAATRQLLVTTESYNAGWRAMVDGQPAAVLRVNGDFLGCLVAPGAHRVELEFHPANRRVATILSACGLGLMLLTFWYRAARHAR